jgi:hypothetical protein
LQYCNAEPLSQGDSGDGSWLCEQLLRGIVSAGREILESPDAFFTRPILNSPYAYPARPWELDKDGQPTQEIVNRRRQADFVTPIPKPKKRRGGEQTALGLGDDERLSSDK